MGQSAAIFLYSFLRHFSPKRVIGVGSGFSSAVMLDTIDLTGATDVELTLIEPNPGRLLANLREEDHGRLNILERTIQEVDPSVFEALEAGDLLFIDSSHVIKYGSDLHRIFFEILPMLPVGCFVHFHDIFHTFEVPREWLREGRYWNENYLLRAFLAYNDSWVARMFSDYVNQEFRNHQQEHMPLCLENPGGSIYLQRTSECFR